MIRLFSKDDESAFRELLTAVYGHSYSYQHLYKKGSIEQLINNGQLLLYSEFDGDDQLVGSTGFWLKDPLKSYIESGLSLRLPIGGRHFCVEEVHDFWQKTFSMLAINYTFVFQHTSTYHSLAQRHAMHFMKAKPCGIILDYSTGEQINKITHSQRPMHALIMISILSHHQHVDPLCFLPDFWAEWLKDIFDHLNLKRCYKIIEHFSNDDDYPDLILETFEINAAISLERRVIRGFSPLKDLKNSFLRSSHRSDLIHLPLNNKEIVATAYPLLASKGYLPVGLRPHSTRPDELIFQYCLDKKITIRTLFEEAKFYGKTSNRMIKQWQALSLQIL